MGHRENPVGEVSRRRNPVGAFLRERPCRSGCIVETLSERCGEISMYRDPVEARDFHGR